MKGASARASITACRIDGGEAMKPPQHPPGGGRGRRADRLWLVLGQRVLGESGVHQGSDISAGSGSNWRVQRPRRHPDPGADAHLAQRRQRDEGRRHMRAERNQHGSAEDQGRPARSASERKQQVQDAATAFGMQLKDVLRQTVAGLSKTDAQERGRVAEVCREGVPAADQVLSRRCPRSATRSEAP
jgi:hypothetical protein